MFTSRAEYRLMLREDNADLRLTETGRRLGLIDDVRWAVYCRKRDAIALDQERLKSTWVGPKNVPAQQAERVLGKPMEREYTLLDLLRRPEVSYRSLSVLVNDLKVSDDPLVAEQVEIQAKYQGYIERQRDEVVRRETQESLPLPVELDYGEVHGLSVEVRQKLIRHQPETIGQASRISGVTPVAIALLLVHLKRDLRPKKKRA
jgi:tRNA uridine 5-carboxymethylaminomethyl modification enzyme